MYPSGIAPTPLASDLIGSRGALLFPLLAGTALGIALACLAGQAPWGDQSMYLVAAGKVLDGARIGRDVIDVSPPLSIWLFEVPVAVSRAAGILPQTATQILLGLLTLVMLAWCVALAQPRGRAWRGGLFAWWLVALLLYATTIQPWYHVATREHMLLLLILPYLFLAVHRLTGREGAPQRHRVAAGLLAVVGCGLKPQHLLVVAAVETFLIWHAGTWRSLVAPEIAGILAGGLAYCAAILVLAPDYLTLVVPFAYEAYLDRGLASWLELVAPVRALKIVAVIGAWLVLRRFSEQRPVADIFMIAGMAAFIVYLLQRKGFEYQLVPALAFFHLALGIVVFGTVAPRFRRWLAPVPRRTALLTSTVAALAAAWLYYPGQVQRAATQWTDVRKTARAALMPHIPRGTTVFMVSPEVGPVHDHLLRYGLNWGSRFTVMFMSEALVTRDGEDPTVAALANWTTAAVVEDLQRYRPGVILVDRCDDPAFPVCRNHGDTREDLLAWFLHDQAFASTWQRYEKRHQVGPYEIWCPTDDDRACAPLLASVPAR